MRTRRKKDLYRKVRRVDREREAGAFDVLGAHDGKRDGRASRAAWRKARRKAMPQVQQ